MDFDRNAAVKKKVKGSKTCKWQLKVHARVVWATYLWPKGCWYS